MSEHLPVGPESLKQPAAEVNVERPKAAPYEQAEQTKHIEEARATVAAEANKSERPTVPLAPVDDRPQLIDNAIKMFRMRRNLSHVQNKLKPAQKSFSKVIHQPLVRQVSESAAQTVSRPSGLLGGGIVAFIGSGLYLTLAHRVGFTYNYLLFLGFFGSGFLLGVALEYAAYGLRKHRR